MCFEEHLGFEKWSLGKQIFCLHCDYRIMNSATTWVTKPGIISTASISSHWNHGIISSAKKWSKDPKALAKIIAAIFNQISKFKIFIIFLMHLMCRLLIVVKPSTVKGNWMVNYANVSLVNLKLVRLSYFTGLEN